MLTMNSFSNQHANSFDHLIIRFLKVKIAVFTKQKLITLFAATILSTSVFAEPKHGIAMLGDPALPVGFASLPYANASAPQGGHIGYGVVGTFDNVNPFILKSMRTTARGVIDTSFGNLVFESLMQRSADEPFTLYGLLGFDGRRVSCLLCFQSGGGFQ